MDQMEHNVKIKNYKKSYETDPFVKYVHILDNPQTYPSKEEQERMLDRFKQLNWQTDKVLMLKSHRDKMHTLKHEQEVILGV